MRALGILLATLSLAMAGSGLAQARAPYPRAAAMGRGYFLGARAGGPRPVFGRPGGAYGRHGVGYGRPVYAPNGYPPAYGAYPEPYRPVPFVGPMWRQQEDYLRQGVRRGQLAPLGGVIQHIRQITPGRQLDAGLEYMGGRLVYRVRWMTARGRRMDYLVDAASGAILSGG